MKIKKIPAVFEEKETDVTRSKDGVLVFEIEKNNEYSIAYGELAVGEKNKKHKLEMQELYYIIQGIGKIIVESREEVIKKGALIIIPENTTQQIQNTGQEKLKFLMIVNPPFDSEKEEIYEDK
ncbi:MAG: cupin domain-containing protein [Candidatus Heimdallarchaeota archaeon]